MAGRVFDAWSSVAELLRWEASLGGPGLPPPVGAGDFGTDGPPRRGSKDALRVLAEQVAVCTACGLHRGRTRTVFSRGSPGAEVAFVGEGPGFHEDREGIPFVGKAGKLLDRMIAAMGLESEQVYVCNVVKCRPPDNRTPLPEEAAACGPYLREQLLCVSPRVVVALGRCAADWFGGPERGWRGTWIQWESIPVMATYHPAYLLRNEEQKRPVWEDLQRVMHRLRGRADGP